MLSLLFLIVASTQLFTPPDQATGLLVTLHDAQGSGVAAADIRILTSAGELLDSRTTNSTGEAHFPAVAQPLVRVQVRGFLPDGAALVQPGDDASGIPFVLDGPDERLALRVEPDGTVLPDPSSMITLDPAPDGLPPVADAPLPGAAPLPTVRTIAGQAASPAEHVASTPLATGASANLFTLVLLLVGLAALGIGVAVALLAHQRGQL